MHAFSRSLIDLYDCAAQARADEFPGEVLRVLNRSLRFDGAVLGTGETIIDPATSLKITHAHVDRRDPGILEAYGEVAAADPVTGAFLHGLEQPVAVDCEAVYAHKVPVLDDFARRFSLRHLMLFGDHPTDDASGRWLVLYRSENLAFDADDVIFLHAAWRHISRAIGVNRAALLDRRDPARAERATALVDAAGRIEAADPRFLGLLAREWPRMSLRSLPPELTESLIRGVAYRGRRIEVSAERQDAFMACTARPADPSTLLSPSEAAVARRFAAGMSAKEIARELGVAPNTVRTQITRLYAKLEVHDKAELAQLLIAAPPLPLS